jgi:hypothetical protein
VRDAARADLEEAARALVEIARERPIRPLPPLATVIDRARAWRQALAAGGVGEQREVLAELVERVEVERLRRGVYRVEIAWTALGQALRAAPARARRRAGRTGR